MVIQLSSQFFLARGTNKFTVDGYAVHLSVHWIQLKFELDSSGGTLRSPVNDAQLFCEL